MITDELILDAINKIDYENLSTDTIKDAIKQVCTYNRMIKYQNSVSTNTDFIVDIISSSNMSFKSATNKLHKLLDNDTSNKFIENILGIPE